MGGFLFIKKDRRSGLEEIEDTYKKSIDVFKKKGLSLAGKIVRKDFILFHFHKYFGTEKNFYEFGHDDFILSIGTFIYKGKTGSGALNFFLEDFQKETVILDELCGQYAVIISINKNVYCFNDYLGLYRIYFDTSQKVFSNSFLAVSYSIKEKTLAVQELYEYLFYGAFFGGKTIFEEIRLMSSEYIWEIFPDSKASLKNLETSSGIEFKDEQSFSRIIADTQVAYFTMLRNIFKDNVTAGLSGGLTQD